MNGFGNTNQFQPFTPKPQKKQVVPLSDNLIESFRHMGSGVGDAIKKDVVQSGLDTALSSIVGQPIQRGELRMNQEVVFSKESTQNNTTHQETMRPTVLIAEKGIEQKIHAIRQELALLSKTVKSLNTDIQKAITEMPEHPGVYHETFFERLRSLLVLIRTQIEDSRTWLTMWSDRRKKKGYWSLYKKHGTKFGLSSERTIAMSAG
jgi:hypothetical protein